MLWSVLFVACKSEDSTASSSVEETSAPAPSEETAVPETAAVETGETGPAETETGDSWPPPLPVAVLTVDPVSGEAPLRVTVGIEGTSTATEEWSLVLDYGDGVVETEVGDGHTYVEEGAYLVHLLVTDAYGQEGHAYAAVAVYPPTCPAADPPELIGALDDPELDEASGLAESRVNPGLFWSHNDSGGDPIVYAIAADGAVKGAFAVTGAELRDWEDLDIGADPARGAPRLYIGDVGDNGAEREEVTVWIVDEPVVDLAGPRVDGVTEPAMAVTLRYPKDVHDSEALFVDPVTDDIYIVTKDRFVTGFTGIYRKAAPHADGDDAVLELVASLDVYVAPYLGMITSATAAPDGSAFAIRGYGLGAFVFLRDESVGTSFAAMPCFVELPASDGLAEAIAFGAAGTHLYTLHEGENAELWSVALH
jgi:hypothetical protein